jgi:hypothetical protein
MAGLGQEGGAKYHYFPHTGTKNIHIRMAERKEV